MVRVAAAMAMMVVLSTGAAFAATVNGTPAADLLEGTAASDVLHGGDGGDILKGLAGDDELYGEGGADGLYGVPGNDFVLPVGDAAADYVDCGDGYDTVKRGSDQRLDRFVNCEKFVN